MKKFGLVTKPEICGEIFIRLETILKDRAEFTHENPDFVVVVGGDGTILNSERLYPSIPKITFRSSDIGSKCSYTLERFDEVINKVLNDDYDIYHELKLSLKDYDLLALNEIQLHNESPISAVRFSIYVDDEILLENIIGDGVIFSTQFGSSGYFSSVGGYQFGYGDGYEKYIGITLNNPFNYDRYMNLISSESKIVIKIHRRNGIFIADNNQNFVDAEEDKEYIIQTSKSTQFVEVR